MSRICVYLYSMGMLNLFSIRTIFLLCTILTIGCNTERGNTIALGFTEPVVDYCRLEPDHPYYISYQKLSDPAQKVPLVIAIDPHGDGLLAMQNFRDALEGLPVAIAGSNKLRNNYAGFEASLNNLYNDLLSKYPVDRTYVIVAGFSGGARMALSYGLKNDVHGIIMYGAGPGQLNSRILDKRIYAVSGTRDFNFYEQYTPLFNGLPDNINYMNDYFRGNHEWPPARYIRESVVNIFKDIPGYQNISGELSNDFLAESDSLQSEEDLFFAGKALEKAWYFAKGKRQRNLIVKKIEEFKGNPDWFTCKQEIETFLKSEEKMKRFYAENLIDPEPTWWSGELSTLAQNISTCADPVECDYFYRLKGFLGIYLYSQINLLLQQNNSSELMDRLLEIYEQVEPDSKDLEKFRIHLNRLREMH